MPLDQGLADSAAPCGGLVRRDPRTRAPQTEKA